jgi:hypothetical protein
MVNISLTLYTKGFFGSFLKSPTQMGSLSINNSVTNISRLGTFKIIRRMLIIRLKYEANDEHALKLIKSMLTLMLMLSISFMRLLPKM